MAEPTFRQKWEWARAHQTPAFDAPALVVDNVRGVGEPKPPDWTQDALRSVPRPLPAIRSPADGRYVEPQVRLRLRPSSWVPSARSRVIPKRARMRGGHPTTLLLWRQSTVTTPPAISIPATRNS